MANNMGRSGAAPQHVAIVGAGSIGIAFAVVFARTGWQVNVQDPDHERLSLVLREISARVTALQEYALLDEDSANILQRVSVVANLDDAVRDVALVQECAPEKVELKRELFVQLDALAPPDAILASSSSALTMSSIANSLPGRARCIIAHPGNPPYLIPVIELVAAPFTDAKVVEQAHAIYASAGLVPVRVAKEIEGFIFNRLQGAVLREAYCLVRDGVTSVDDIDSVMRNGLGLRWSIIGPFETADLNTRGGIGAHAQKMGPAYERMGSQRGQHDPWTPELVAQVEAQRRQILPLEDWEARVIWRDRALMRLAAHRKQDDGKSGQ
jgi:L-gulonate 3-dehydrogenase